MRPEKRLRKIVLQWLQSAGLALRPQSGRYPRQRHRITTADPFTTPRFARPRRGTSNHLRPVWIVPALRRAHVIDATAIVAIEERAAIPVPAQPLGPVGVRRHVPPPEPTPRDAEKHANPLLLGARCLDEVLAVAGAAAAAAGTFKAQLEGRGRSIHDCTK